MSARIPPLRLQSFFWQEIPATSMKCPACGSDCVHQAPEILKDIPTRFLPCARCSMRILDKRVPLPAPEYAEPCSCGKRFIDEVFAHMYVIMQEEGDLTSRDPLIAVGSPLVHPGFAMDRPPFLPAKSLLLLSGKVQEKAARRIFAEVPEIRGVVKTADYIPGLVSLDEETVPRVYALLAGCDVRADIYPLATGPSGCIQAAVPYPRRVPARRISKTPIRCCPCGNAPGPALCGCLFGAGNTWPRGGVPWRPACGYERCLVRLGVLVGVQSGCQPWLPGYRRSANLRASRGYGPSSGRPGSRQNCRNCGPSRKLKSTREIFRHLDRVIPRDAHPVAVLDIFDKDNKKEVSALLRDWKGRMGGNAFIP